MTQQEEKEMQNVIRLIAEEEGVTEEEIRAIAQGFIGSFWAHMQYLGYKGELELSRLVFRHDRKPTVEEFLLFMKEGVRGMLALADAVAMAVLGKSNRGGVVS